MSIKPLFAAFFYALVVDSFQVVHMKEAVTYLNGLNSWKNIKDGHLDGHLDGHFGRWKNETFRLDGHLDGHFFLVLRAFFYEYFFLVPCFPLFINYCRG